MAEISQTLDRGLQLLTLLADAPGGLTVTEAAAALEVNRTVVYRLVETLERRGLARRGSGGRISIGFAAIALGASVHPMLRQVATPVLRTLAEEIGATAHLTVADGQEGLAVAVIEPTWTDLHVAYRIGSRHPLTAGAAGRAIVAGRAGESGYVASSGELQAGASGVAAPVVDVTGVEASVGVVALGDLNLDAIGPRVVQAAEEMSTRLGWPPRSGPEIS